MNRTIWIAVLAVAAAFGAALPAGAEHLEKPILTLAGAKHVVAVAVAEARRLNAGGAIAVVDDGGHLLALERLDDTFPAAATVATEKARTAATFRRDTRIFEDAIKNGRTSLLGVDVMTPLQGGIPLTMDGVVVGAVGVSGAMNAQQDEDIAKVAATAMNGAVGDAVHYFPSQDVMTAFAKGAPLVEVNGYKVHASRRVSAGQAEVHEQDTDIIHVLEGSATFVTGGKVVDGKQTGPGEVRGARIEGGETRTLAPGDVIIVPAGTPHWFKDVKGPVLYYVVKTV